MGAANGIISKIMSKEITPEVQAYIDRLVSISREMTRFVGIDHAALDTSGHALKAAEERLETMKCEGQTVCALEVEGEINAYIQIADV